MTYILPVLYVIVSYTFFLLAGCFDTAIKLQISVSYTHLSVPPETLALFVSEFYEEFENRFGSHIHILDWALHLDEGQ